MPTWKFECGNFLTKVALTHPRNLIGQLHGVDFPEPEYRIFNDGTGWSVDQQYLRAYRRIAAVLLKHLFNVSLPETRPTPTLERLVVLWAELDERLEERAQAAGIEPGHTFFWEEAIQSGVIDSNQLAELAELRLSRNAQLHSTTVDKKKFEYAVSLAETLA